MSPTSSHGRKRFLQELLCYRGKAQTAAREADVAVGLANSAVGGVASSGFRVGDDPLSFKLLGARLPHGEALAIRLEFVGFVVSKSPLELTFGHVETLWRDFLGNPLCGACVFLAKDVQ